MINNAADRRLINYFQAYHWADAHHVIAPKRRTIPHWKYCNMKTFYVTAQHHLKWVPYHSNTGKYKVYFWKSWFFFYVSFICSMKLSFQTWKLTMKSTRCVYSVFCMVSACHLAERKHFMQYTSKPSVP